MRSSRRRRVSTRGRGPENARSTQWHNGIGNRIRGELMSPPTSAAADELRDQLLDAAEGVFYARGIQAVSMDELREASGLALRRIYQIYPAKDQIVVAVLRRRHRSMMTNIAAEVGHASDAREAVLAVFDYLEKWFAEPSFRGCPWMNAYGELGPTSAAITSEV